MSNPLNLVELDPVSSSLDDARPDELDLHPDVFTVVGAGASLCDRCQNFDIQSFTRSSSRRRGYLLRDVEAAAGGCEFCSLLLDSLKDVEKPKYFYDNFRGGYNDLKPDLYVHMTLSENYSGSKKQSNSLPLGANRLLTEVGDRNSDVKSTSEQRVVSCGRSELVLKGRK
jgi:hypothetical protein